MRYLVVLAVVARLAVCATANPDASVQQIIQRSVAANEANWKQAPNYAFQERDLVSKHEGAKTSKTYQVYLIEGSQYNELLAVNDQPLSPEQKVAERRKLSAEIRKRQTESPRERSKRVAKYTRERTEDRAMLNEMAAAFDYKMTGEATVAGHSVWVLEASPKAGYVPKSRDAKVLTGMRGKMWIDKATYQWVRVEAEVVRPVTMYGIAKVGNGTRFELEQAPVPGVPNLWLPTRLDTNVNAKVLGMLNEDSTEDDKFWQYQPMQQVMADLKLPR